MFEKIQGLIKTVLKQEYAKASIYYVIANIIGQGIVLISSAWFTRMMSKADYGLVSTYSTWVLVLNTFICLNLFISVRTAYVDFNDDYDNYNSSVLLLSILCGIAMTILIACITLFCGLNFGIYEALLACIQSVALNIVNYMLAIQAMKNEYKQRTFMMIAPNWTHTILSVILMFIFAQNLYMAKISGNAIGVLAFGVVCTFLLFMKARPKINKKYWKHSLKISVPSIFNTLSDLILMQCDRLMLTSMVGAAETAEYSVIYNVSSIIVSIYQAINGAWVPWFFGKVKNNEAGDIKRYQGYYMILFTVFSCGMMTISPELIKIMAPRNYWDGIRYVAPIVVASYLIYLYAFFSSYLLYEKRTMRIAINTIIAALLNLELNFVLIPKYKAVGAVTATVVSYIVLFALHLAAVHRSGKKYFSFFKMLANAASVVIYGVLFYIVRDMWFVRYVLFIVFTIIIYLTDGRRIIRRFMGENK